MRPDVDSPSLTPEDRFREVAVLLAVGLLRLHARATAGRPDLEKSSNSSPNCLEIPGEIVLSGHTG
jgi:hypothetical protein